MARTIKHAIEVISKASIVFKIEAGRKGQPEEYISYFED